MCKFKQILLAQNTYNYAILRYIPEIKTCFCKYLKYLQDDFSPFKDENILNIISSLAPHFWVITTKTDDFMGFVYLDNFTGNKNFLYSAELTTCFDRKAWGSFTRYSAKFFLKKCFDEYGLHKIEARIYPDNYRIKALLKSSGFEYESTLKNATMRLGKFQDIEIYGLYRSYYYKNEVNYERTNK